MYSIKVKDNIVHFTVGEITLVLSPEESEHIAKALNQAAYDVDWPPYDYRIGDDKLCDCGHPYYRHFDTYEDMLAIGCKYCECEVFEEPK